MTPHSLAIRVCTVGCGRWLGKASALSGQACGHREKTEAVPLGKPRCETRARTFAASRFQPPFPPRLGALSAFESPLLAFQSFYLFTYFDQPRPSEFFFHVTKQFITKTNGQNLSHLKHNPSIRRINSTEAADGCQVLYFTWFTKVLFVQYECQ